NEACAGSPLTFVLVAAAVATVLARSPGRPRTYALLLLCAYLIFALVLRWQSTNTRLQLPFLVIAAPLVGVAAQFWFGRANVTMSLRLAQVLVILAIPYLLCNWFHPLIGVHSVLTVE